MSDYSNLWISTVLAYHGFDHGQEIDVDITRHLVLNAMVSHKKKFGSQYGEVVICCDGRNLWRKKVYPYYKASRKASRDDSGLDWDALLGWMETHRKEFVENLPYKVVQVEGAEGDDVVAVLAKKLPGPHMIISNDKDMAQLQKYPGISQYASRKGEEVKVANPQAFLKELIIRGDGGDGVPNILSDDDVFVAPPGADGKKKRQKSIMEKSLVEWQWQEFEEMRVKPSDPESPLFDPDKIKRNKVMIDFDFIPQEITDKVLEEYENAPVSQKRNLLTYFGEHRLRALLDDIPHF